MGAYLSPEDLEAIANSGLLDAQQPLLERQLAQAAALRGQKRTERKTPAGNFLSGLGGLLTNVSGALQENDLQQQAQVLAQRRGAAEAPGRRLQALLGQQKVAAGDLDLEAGRFGLDTKKAETEASNAPLSEPERYALAETLPGAPLEGVRQGRAKDLREAFGLAADARQQRAASKRRGAGVDPRGEKQLQDLGEAISKGGTAGFYSQYDAAKRIIDDPRFAKDLPGFGRLAGRLPDDLIGKEGVELRQAIGQMLAEYRKGVTGAGMSDAERAEYANITGLLQSGNEDSVRAGVDRLRESMDARTRAFAAGMRPEVATEYGRRIPRLQQVLTGSGPTAASGTSAPITPDTLRAAQEWLRANPNHPKAAGVAAGIRSLQDAGGGR